MSGGAPSVVVSQAATTRELPRRRIALDGGRSIALAQMGQGPDCLLVHGTLTTLEDMWHGLAGTLADTFRVTAVDRPGHGRSLRKRYADASPWRQATLIHEAAVRAGLQRPIIVGHSYGATVALAYALQYPEEMAGVVALAPMCFPELRLEALLFGPRGVPGVGPSLARIAAAASDPMVLPLLWQAMYLPQVMPGAVAESLPLALSAGPEHMMVEGEDSLALPAAVAAMSASYALCRVPVHIMGGECDAVVNNAAHGRSAALLIPSGRFTWIPGCGHMLHHFARDAVVDACIGSASLSV